MSSTRIAPYGISPKTDMFRYNFLPKRDEDQVTLALYAQEVQSMDPHSRRDLMGTYAATLQPPTGLIINPHL